MRRIGTLSDRQEAGRFGDFLLTQQINAQIEPADDEWAIWVHEEDRLDDARRELEAFRENPRAKRFEEAVVAADRLRHEEVRKRQQAKKNTVNMAERWRRPMIMQIPLTFALVVLSVVISLGTEFGEQMNSFGGRLTLISVRSTGEGGWRPVDPQTGGDRRSDLGLEEIRHGQVWRMVTPIFLHLGWMHLIFNMYWTVIFGSLIETRQGTWYLLAIVLVTAVISTLGSYAFGEMGGGMSGVGYGMFGYLWMLGKMNPRSSIHLPPNVVFLFLAWLVICTTTDVFGPIGNYAHGFGLLAGMAIGAARGAWEKRAGVS